MSTHPLRLAALAVAMLTLGVALSAQVPGFGPRHGMDRGPGLKGLHLTEDQQTQVKAIHERHQAAFKTKGEAAWAAHEAMRNAMADAATDAKTLQALHGKASAAQFQMMLEHRALRQEILPLLTAEQKAKFEKGPMGMGPGGERGMGPGRGMGPRGKGGMGMGRGPGSPGMMGQDCPPAKP
jgi:Spy/CpxP family protein refolding chaperone